MTGVRTLHPDNFVVIDVHGREAGKVDISLAIHIDVKLFAGQDRLGVLRKSSHIGQLHILVNRDWHLLLRFDSGNVDEQEGLLSFE